MRTISRTDPGELLFGKTRGAILSLLLSRPDEFFYVRQIAHDTAISIGAVQRELGHLHGAGIILRTQRGNQVLYQANREGPIFSELSSLVAKTVGIFRVLGTTLLPFQEKIDWAFVYGSVARQQQTAGSDVDLMIVGAVSLDELLPQLVQAESALGRSVNPTVYSRSEFIEKIQHKNHFVSSVLAAPKVTLAGEQVHEFREVE